MTMVSTLPWRFSVRFMNSKAADLYVFCDEGLQDFTFVIYRTPQIVKFAIDLHIGLIEMPSPMATASHPVHSLSADVGREHRTKAIPPQTHGLMTEINTALEKQVFYVPQRQRKSDLEHHDQPDDFRRRMKITKWVICLAHACRLATCPCLDHPFDSTLSHSSSPSRSRHHELNKP